MKFDVYILHAAELKTSLGCACDGCRSLGGEKKDLKKKERNKKICIKQRRLWKRCAALWSRDEMMTG